MVNLPQELLDEIFSHLPPHDKETLSNCSLVSKSWVEPSRRLLFADIRLRLDTYQSQLDRISSTNSISLCHVRSLTYFVRVYSIFVPDCCVFALGDYLPSFCKLQTLGLHGLRIEPSIPKHLELFSAFQHSLSSLSFTAVSTTWSSFVALAGHFPNLRDLKIASTSFQTGDLPIPNIVHAGRGRLGVGPLHEWDLRLLCGRFAELKPEYNQLELIRVYNCPLVAAVERSLEYLTINLTGQYFRCPSRCVDPRELVCVMQLPPARVLVSSITSKNLQMLTFIGDHISWDFLSKCCWRMFDDLICELVDRLQMTGYKHTLEVELRAEFVEMCRDPEEIMPKFKRKGRVRVTEIPSGRFWA